MPVRWPARWPVPLPSLRVWAAWRRWPVPWWRPQPVSPQPPPQGAPPVRSTGPTQRRHRGRRARRCPSLLPKPKPKPRWAKAPPAAHSPAWPAARVRVQGRCRGPAGRPIQPIVQPKNSRLAASSSPASTLSMQAPPAAR